MSKNKKDLKWYENGRMITYLIIFIVILAIIVSQSFAVNSGWSLISFGSVINHNVSYILILIYFGILSLPFGKKYFNYLNIFLTFIYLLSSVTSFLTLFQSFGLSSIISFLLNVVLSLYLIHTMFRGTRIWKDFSLNNSPFNEITNDGYFFAITFLLVFQLVVNLISTVVMSGLFISILDALYILLVARYIYLYRDYLDYKKVDVDNKGNFDDIKTGISSVGDKINEVIDNVDISGVADKINEAIDKVDISGVTDKITNAIENANIGEKVTEFGGKIMDVSGEIAKKTEDFIEKSRNNISNLDDESETDEEISKDKSSEKRHYERKNDKEKSSDAKRSYSRRTKSNAKSDNESGSDDKKKEKSTYKTLKNDTEKEDSNERFKRKSSTTKKNDTKKSGDDE